MLFDETSLRKLQQLTLVTSRVRAGALRGERRSLKRGASVEFADYRDYVPGDDLRRVDWNVYARLDRPFIKLREEEEDLAVHILVDASQSMDWGEGAQHKFSYALAPGGGTRLDRVEHGRSGFSGHVERSEASRRIVGSLTARPAVSAALAQIPRSAASGGQTDLEAAVRRYLIKPRRPGLVILISDLLSPHGYQSALKTVATTRPRSRHRARPVAG